MGGSELEEPAGEAAWPCCDPRSELAKSCPGASSTCAVTSSRAAHSSLLPPLHHPGTTWGADS